MYKISVVTPSCNQGGYISDCILSVLKQNYNNFEHIIIDNCSYDETNSILSRNNHLRIIQEKDNGQSQALNKGCSIADGVIICWLNTDDLLTANTFKKINSLFDDKNIDIVYGNSIVIDQIRKKEYVNKPILGSIEDFRYWWRGKVKLHQPSIFFRKSVYEKIGPFREDLHYIMDYEYWSRTIISCNFYKLDYNLSIQRIHRNAKTCKWHRFYEEKEKVFSCYYTHDTKLMLEKTRVMANRYYDLSVSSFNYNKIYALRMFYRFILNKVYYKFLKEKNAH